MISRGILLRQFNSVKMPNPTLFEVFIVMGNLGVTCYSTLHYAQILRQFKKGKIVPTKDFQPVIVKGIMIFSGIMCLGNFINLVEGLSKGKAWL